MASVYDDYDLSYLWNGDYDLSADGDLADTTSDALLSIVQDIQTIVASSLKDWEIYPSKGAGLADYVGEPNTRSTADQIHDRLRISIISEGNILEQDLEIRIVPVHVHKLFIAIAINAVPTQFNSLNGNVKLVVRLVFDFFEQDLFFLDKNPNLLGDVF